MIARAAAAVVTVLTLVALPPAWSAPARTIHVPSDVPTIQAAITAARDGDTVLVAPGTYPGGLVVSKAVTLASHYHTTSDRTYIGQTVLDGADGPYVISVRAARGRETAIVGFTIRNARDGVAAVGSRLRLLDNRITRTGDAVDCERCHMVARRNVVEGNRDDAFDLDGASEAVIEENVIRDNGDDGIEVRLHPYIGPTLDIVIRSNVISGNGEDGIQLIDYPGLSSRVIRIERNVIDRNRMVGVGMMQDGNTVEDFTGAPIPEPVYITNNTFAGNDHALTGGANVTARNNIFVGSARVGVKNVAAASTVASSLFWQNGVHYQASNVDRGTAIVADPRLDAAYRLCPGSPAIDRGVEVGAAFQGAAPDLGAYETLDRAPLPVFPGAKGSAPTSSTAATAAARR